MEEGNIWKVLIPLLIGAGLTFFTQFAIAFYNRWKEKWNKKRELLANSRSQIYLIAQVIKDLVMYKTHKQYYIACARSVSDSTDIWIEYREQHYIKGKEQRETEEKLDKLIGEYFKIVTEFVILTSNKNYVDNYLNRIYEYSHPKPRRFNQFGDDMELEDKLDLEEERLNNEFNDLVALFNLIHDRMYKNRTSIIDRFFEWNHICPK